MPIFHVLGLLSDLGDRYWVLPERTAGGHVVSGFASRDDRGVVRVLLYTHHAQDTQSRSGATFDVTLDLAGLGWDGTVSGAGVSLRPRPQLAVPAGADRSATVPPPAGRSDPARQAAALRALEGSDPAAQRQAMATLQELGPAALQAAAPILLKLAGEAKDPSIREAARDTIRKAMRTPGLSPRRGRGDPAAVRVPRDQRGDSTDRGRRPPATHGRAGRQRMHVPGHRAGMTWSCHRDIGPPRFVGWVRNPPERPRRPSAGFTHSTDVEGRCRCRRLPGGFHPPYERRS